VPELQLAAGVGLDGDVALNQAAGKVRAFGAGLMDTVDSTLSQHASLSHFTLEPLLTMTAMASHFRRRIPVALTRILGCQPDLVRLILFLGGLVDGAFLTIYATKRPMSHCASFH